MSESCKMTRAVLLYWTWKNMGESPSGMKSPFPVPIDSKSQATYPTGVLTRSPPPPRWRARSHYVRSRCLRLAASAGRGVSPRWTHWWSRAQWFRDRDGAWVVAA